MKVCICVSTNMMCLGAPGFFYFCMSDSHPEAKNGFGLHTDQVNKQHKIEAFKASKLAAALESTVWNKADRYSGSSQRKLFTRSPLV